MKFLTQVTVASAILFHSLGGLNAHEYWIEAQDYQPNVQQELQAHLRVGQDFAGDILPFIPQTAIRYEVYDAGGVREPEGLAGDRPALRVLTRDQGMMVLAYESSKSRVIFDAFEDFASYLDNEGLTEIAAQHAQRGLPEEDFSETYSRFPKALIDVGGTGEGADQVTGLRAELVALDNPYAAEIGDTIRIQLLWEGDVQPDRQIRIFLKPTEDEADQVQVMDKITDANGMIELTLQPDTRYLLSSVKMLAVDPNETRGSVWESFWSSLTFETHP